jgi:hypothetical protein
MPELHIRCELTSREFDPAKLTKPENMEQLNDFVLVILS